MVQVFNVSRGATAARSPWRRLWQRACIGAVLCAAAGGAWAQSADLVLSNHVVSPDPVPAGGIATITMTVQNNGTGTASNVTLTDTIPVGSTFVSMAASNGGTCTGTPPYECTWAAIPFPGTRTVTLQVRLPSANVWTNSASVASATADPNGGNNGLTRTITVQQAADLAVTASVSTGGATIAAGTPYSYTLNVANNGPDPLPAGQSPTVTFNVPAGSSITSQPTGTGWTCSPGSGYPLTDAPGPPVGTLITCTRNDGLASGGASFPPITVNAVGNVTGAVDATFDVSSNYLDGDITNNTASVSQPLSAGTDMRINKTVALSGSPIAGTRATFTLRAGQVSGSDPTGVTVTDTLPAGFTYVSHSGASPWGCNWVAGVPAGSTGTLTCTYPGTYTGGPNSTLPDITLVADMTASGSIPNTGTVAADQTDNVPGNNTSTINVDNSVDLSITKMSSLSPVVVGQPYNWNITVRNHGPMQVLTGQRIEVTESIPAGMSITGAPTGPTGSNWACTTTGGGALTYPVAGATDIRCTHTRGSNLAVNSNAPVLSLPAVNTSAGALTNNACLGLSGNGPGELGSQTNCVGAGITGTPALNSADIRIEKTVVGPNPVVLGQPLTYQLVATNLTSGVPATNVHVYDTVNSLRSSAGAQGLVSITTTQGTCTPAAPANVTSASIDCDLGTLTFGSPVTITITIRPTNTETNGLDLNRSNTATINSLDVGDNDRSNNTSTVTSVVQPRVDMTVSKTVNPSPVRVGQPMTYTITANNAGPSYANNVRINDLLPANTAFISVGTPSNGGTCGTVPTVGAVGTGLPGGPELVCTWASVAPGGNRTVTLTVRPLEAALTAGTPPGTLRNTVTVATDSTETDLNNNSSFIDATVIASALDVLVQKTDSVDPVVLGATTRYTVTMRNAGPSYGTQLVMTDTFPNAGNTARFSYQGGLTASIAGVAIPAPACTEPAIGATSGTLTCTFPTIAIGPANEVLVEYDMRAESIITAGDYSGTQGNHVVVAVQENETQMGNNQVDEDTTTRRDAPAPGSEIDLGIVKTVTPGRALPGTEYDYTLTVTNNETAGSGRDVVPANGAQVTDTLPAGLTLVSAPGCSYDTGSRQVVCVVSNLAAAANVAFTVRVRLDSPYTGPASLSNTAAVDIPGDPVPGNNTSTVPKDVGNPPPPAAIPTLSEWGLILLSLMLGTLAVRRMPVRGRR